MDPPLPKPIAFRPALSLDASPDRLTTANLRFFKQATKSYTPEEPLVTSTDASVASSDLLYQKGLSFMAPPAASPIPSKDYAQSSLNPRSSVAETVPLPAAIPSRPSSRGSITSDISMVAHKDGVEGARHHTPFMPPPYLAPSENSSISNLLLHPTLIYTSTATNVTGTVPSRWNNRVYAGDDLADSVKSIKSLTFDDLDSVLSTPSRGYLDWHEEKPQTGISLKERRGCLN